MKVITKNYKKEINDDVVNMDTPDNSGCVVDYENGE